MELTVIHNLPTFVNSYPKFHSLMLQSKMKMHLGFGLPVPQDYNTHVCEDKTKNKNETESFLNTKLVGMGILLKLMAMRCVYTPIQMSLRLPPSPAYPLCSFHTHTHTLIHRP